MGRMYVVQFSAVAVTAAQDLFELKATAAKGLILHECKITQDSDAGDAQSEQLRFTLKRAAGTYTSGSGGSAPAFEKVHSGDAAAAVTAEANNTTRAAAGTGTLTTLFPDGENIHNGWHHQPTPECRFDALAGTSPEALIVGLESVPADSLTMNGYAIVEEVP